LLGHQWVKVKNEKIVRIFKNPAFRYKIHNASYIYVVAQKKKKITIFFYHTKLFINILYSYYEFFVGFYASLTIMSPYWALA